MDGVAYVLGVVVAVWVSCSLAKAAGSYDGAGWWGWLGPAGWIVAAIVGVRKRVDRIVESVSEGAQRRTGRRK